MVVHLLIDCPYSHRNETALIVPRLKAFGMNRGVRQEANLGSLAFQDYWLVCREPGCGRKYPVRDSIPVMLVEEGDKWINVTEDDLPLPPPPE